MRTTNTESTSTVGRRTVLAAGGTILAGLGSGSSVLTAGAREEPDRRWPLGGPDEQDETREWNGKDGSDAPEYDEERTITDDTGSVRFTVPAAWDDVNSTQVGYNPSIIAAPDLDGYLETRDVPGVEVAVTTRLRGELDEILGRLVDYSRECEDGGQRGFRSEEFEFLSQIWYQCGARDTVYLTIVGEPANDRTNGTTGESGPEDDASDEAESATETPTDAPYVILFGAQVVSEPDLKAVATAIESLEVRAPGGQFLSDEL